MCVSACRLRDRRSGAGSDSRGLILTFGQALAGSCGHPEGAGHGWPAFSDQAMDGLSENGDGAAHPLSDLDLTRKVLSFGYFSLHQQRKVTRRKAKALNLRSEWC